MQDVHDRFNRKLRRSEKVDSEEWGNMALFFTRAVNNIFSPSEYVNILEIWEEEETRTIGRKTRTITIERFAIPGSRSTASESDESGDSDEGDKGDESASPKSVTTGVASKEESEPASSSESEGTASAYSASSDAITRSSGSDSESRVLTGEPKLNAKHTAAELESATKESEGEHEPATVPVSNDVEKGYRGTTDRPFTLGREDDR